MKLWVQGDFFALLVAVSFCVLFNLALLSTFVWQDWLGNMFPVVAWPVIGIVWLGSWIVSSRSLDEALDPAEVLGNRSDALFISAQTEYLKGNWHEAEALLVRQLRFRPRDVESHLLMATLHRHNGNYDGALNEIETLSKFDGAVRWQHELEKLEQQVLSERQDADSSVQPSTAAPETFSLPNQDQVTNQHDDNDADLSDSQQRAA